MNLFFSKTDLRIMSNSINEANESIGEETFLKRFKMSDDEAFDIVDRAKRESDEKYELNLAEDEIYFFINTINFTLSLLDVDYSIRVGAYKEEAYNLLGYLKANLKD